MSTITIGELTISVAVVCFYSTVTDFDRHYTVTVSDEQGKVRKSFTRPTEYGARLDAINYASRIMMQG